MGYNLEERTLRFSLDVIKLCKIINPNFINRPLMSQLIRSATSVGANYREANGAVSKKDFCNKIYICKKEAKESLYWLDILEMTEDQRLCHPLTEEANQLVLIFSKIASKSKS